MLFVCLLNCFFLQTIVVCLFVKMFFLQTIVVWLSVKCAAISVNSRCFETKLLLNYRNESERKREQFRHMINIFTNNCQQDKINNNIKVYHIISFDFYPWNDNLMMIPSQARPTDLFPHIIQNRPLIKSHFDEPWFYDASSYPGFCKKYFRSLVY